MNLANSFMVWTSDKSQTGLMKAKNGFTKILLNSCSIIDVHGYPERKQDNLYYNIKTEIQRK